MADKKEKKDEYKKPKNGEPHTMTDIKKKFQAALSDVSGIPQDPQHLYRELRALATVAIERVEKANKGQYSGGVYKYVLSAFEVAAGNHRARRTKEERTQEPQKDSFKIANDIEGDDGNDDD
jgi:hypothetical protein